MLLGHRYYDQSTGRFLSEDPARDGANWYAYCANNPLTAVDPTGTVMVPETVVRNTASAIGSVLGAVATASVLAAAGFGGSSVTGGGSLVAAAEAAPQAIAAGGMLGAAIGNSAVDLWYACTGSSGSGVGSGGSSKRDDASRQRAIRSLERQIAEHRQKLAKYKENPFASDNKGFLKNASKGLQQKIIKERIDSLNHQINNFEHQVKVLKGS